MELMLGRLPHTAAPVPGPYLPPEEWPGLDTFTLHQYNGLMPSLGPSDKKLTLIYIKQNNSRHIASTQWKIIYIVCPLSNYLTNCMVPSVRSNKVIIFVTI